jgi:Zn-finger nucleic acid-binding protein
MNRKLHGKRSGVIVDCCRDHGLWLDAGELRQLMEWSRAGGEKLDKKNREHENKYQLDQKRRKKVEAIYQKKRSMLNHSPDDSMQRQQHYSGNVLKEIADIITDLFEY